MGTRRRKRSRRRAGSVAPAPPARPTDRESGEDPVSQTPRTGAAEHRTEGGDIFPSGFPRADIAAVAVLALLVAASFFPAFRGGFVWDDTIITALDSVRDWGGIWKIWFDPKGAFIQGETGEGHYWPIVYSTFWLEHKLWGFSPAGYHVVNILLHFANTVLLWRLLSRLAVPGAWFAAALFAVHPLHTESVAWIIARKDLLSGMFYLLAFGMWVRFLESPCRRRYAAALLLFAAGLLCKTVVVTLPAAFLILQWWRRGRVTRGDVLRLLPFFAVGFAFALGDTLYYKDLESLSLGYSMVERVLIAARALCFYAGKLMWPADLAVIYPHWDVSAGSPVAWACAAAVAVAVGAAWFLRRKAGRGPLACLLFFAVTLSPVLGFIDYGYMQFSFVADRYQYLAGIGLMALFAAAGARVIGKLPGAAARAARGTAVILLVILGALTWNQSELFKDEITLFGHIISRNPHARSAHGNLGLAFYRDDQFKEAEKHLLRAVELTPDDKNAAQNLAEALRMQNRHEESLEWYRAVIDMDSDYANAYAGMGDALFKLERYGEAASSMKRALELEPDHPEVFNINVLIGRAFDEMGRRKESEEYYRRAVDINPGAADDFHGKAESLRDNGHHEESLRWYRAAIKANPDSARSYAAMGDALFRLKRYGEAASSMKRALEIQPDIASPEVLHFLIGKASEELGRAGEAEKGYRSALDAAPGFFSEAFDALVQLYFSQKRYEETIELYRELLSAEPENVAAHSGIAAAMINMGRSEEAIGMLERALSLDETDAETHAKMGVALINLGRLEESLASFKRALSLDPGMKSARENHDMAERMLRRRGE